MEIYAYIVWAYRYYGLSIASIKVLSVIFASIKMKCCFLLVSDIWWDILLSSVYTYLALLVFQHGFSCYLALYFIILS